LCSTGDFTQLIHLSPYSGTSDEQIQNLAKNLIYSTTDERISPTLVSDAITRRPTVLQASFQERYLSDISTYCPGSLANIGYSHPTSWMNWAAVSDKKKWKNMVLFQMNVSSFSMKRIYELSRLVIHVTQYF
jgi:hypothetical protein